MSDFNYLVKVIQDVIFIVMFHLYGESETLNALMEPEHQCQLLAVEVNKSLSALTEPEPRSVSRICGSNGEETLVKRL